MKFQAATALVRKAKTGIQSTRAAMKKLISRSENSVGIRENIKKEVSSGKTQRKAKPLKAAPKSIQSQTHRRTKGTFQNPQKSQERHEKNLNRAKRPVHH